MHYILKMSWNFSYIVIDGLDGIGKTTQIALLEQHLKDRQIETLCTRALGGPIGSELEQLRTFLFQSKFQSETEEDVIELLSRLNVNLVTKAIDNFYKKPGTDDIPFYILQDRGIISHFCYAKSKGHARSSTFYRFEQILQRSSKYNAVNIVLVPKNIDMILERIKDRGHHNQFHDKYENFEIQKKVYENIIYEVQTRDVGRRDLGDYCEFHLVEVEDTDQPLDVHKKILEILKL